MIETILLTRSLSPSSVMRKSPPHLSQGVSVEVQQGGKMSFAMSVVFCGGCFFVVADLLWFVGLQEAELNVPSSALILEPTASSVQCAKNGC